MIYIVIYILQKMTKIYYDELLLLFTLYLVYNLYKYGSFGFNYFF